MTHSGQNVTVFCLNGEPIFFEVEKKVIPTGTHHNQSRLFIVFKFSKIGVICNKLLFF